MYLRAQDDAFFFAKGSVESTHKVPTSHYHTKHCHAAVVSLGGRFLFGRKGPPPQARVGWLVLDFWKLISQSRRSWSGSKTRG